MIWLKLDGKVCLFTTDGKIYENKDKKKIYTINPDALYEFFKKVYRDKSILMSQLILQWFEYLEEEKR